MHRSESLILELIASKIIPNRLCDVKKAQVIIRKYFCDIHRDAVERTVIAKNRVNFKFPDFED